jgi:excinuclease ABC subunit C
MKSRGGKIIYIGKAKILKNRVRQYFVKQKSTNHYASHVMRDKAHDIEWMVTDTEQEALILEANLIRKYSPRYNVLLRDDKHFPYLRVTLSEPFPRVLVTRKVDKTRKRGARSDVFFGPYTNPKAVRKTIQTIRKFFHIRDCQLKLPLKNPIQPCLTHHIGRCEAPCAEGMCSKEQYDVSVQQTLMFLKGKSTELMDRLQKEMQDLSKSQQFERAAKMRDRIRDLRALQENQKMDLGDNHIHRDLVAIARIGKVGAVVLLKVREGILMDQKVMEISCPLEESLGSILSQVLIQLYGIEGQKVPSEIILGQEVENKEEVQQVLENLQRKLNGNKKKGSVTLTVPERGVKRKQISLAEKNAQVQVAEFVAKKEARTKEHHAVTALQEDLQLPYTPHRIEAFDISHLSGTDTVASMVVFVNGQPKKSEYRKYNIKTVEGIDDFASMKEVVTRRVKRLAEEQKEFPDLFLIDGGKGQLGMAYQVLKSFGRQEQPVIGLAKRLEEVFFPGKSESILIPKHSSSLTLLQRVRDESHRFAITFQRSKRKKYTTKGILHEIPGLGEKSVTQLLSFYGSVPQLQKDSVEGWAKLVGPKRAQAMKAFFKA